MLWLSVSLALGFSVFFFDQSLGILIFALVLLFWGAPIAFAWARWG